MAVETTRSVIVTTRVGYQYYVTYITDLDSENPVVRGMQQGFYDPDPPVGVTLSQLPADGDTTVTLGHWLKAE